MSYSVNTIAPFDKEAKRLSKKYKSLKKELIELIQKLPTEPDMGTSLGNNCYKIRLAVKSKGKGKSGGARIVTNVYVTDKTIFLLTIYDKSEKSNLSDKELKILLSLV